MNDAIRRAARGRRHDWGLGGLLRVWRLGGLSWVELARRTFRRSGADGIVGQSAKLSFYLLLSLFPLLLFVIALLGWLLQTHGLPEQALDRYIGTVLPDPAAVSVQEILERATRESGFLRLSFTLLFTWWSSLLGMRAVIDGLNAAYEVVDSRTWWRRILLATWLTAVLLALMAAAVTLLAAGQLVIGTLSDRLGLHEAGTPWVRSLRECLVVVSALAIFNLAYHFAPNIRHRVWHWLMPGTVIALGAWLTTSYAFQNYLRQFDRYATTYGPLGAAVVLLLWFYVSGIVFLVGAEINAIIEKEIGNLRDGC